jgi:hypothetical protein
MILFSTRRVLSCALLSLGLLVATPSAFAALADSTSLVLSAAFDSDSVDAPPNASLPGPPSGDSLTYFESAGTIRVRAGVGTLDSKPVEMKQATGPEGGLNLFAYPASGPGCGSRMIVQWRSLADSIDPCFMAAVMRSSSGAILAAIEYRPGGVLTYNSVGGVGPTLPVTYTLGIDQLFTVALDLVSQTSSLAINGSPIVGFQNVPFAQPGEDFQRLGFEMGCTSAQVLAVDDLSIVAVCDNSPSVTAPGVATGEAGGFLGFTVSASDPDGEGIFSLTADLATLPEGDATFTTNETSTSGTFAWHPNIGDAGSYVITFTASNALSGSASTTLNVLAAGITARGTLTWTPQPGDEGEYDIIFTATNAAGETGSLTTHVTVFPPTSDSLRIAPTPTRDGSLLSPESPTKGPIVEGPSSASASAGSTLTVDVTTTESSALLAGSLLRRSSASSAEVTLTADLSALPANNDASFVVDHEPNVTAPGSVSGTVGGQITVSVTASDPDADPIAALEADLAGLPAGNNAVFTAGSGNRAGTLVWTPAAGQEGTYSVRFIASNSLTGEATTQITVLQVLDARAFMPGTDKKIKLATLRPFACLVLEPVGGSFTLDQIDFGSIVMLSTGTGTVSQIPARMERNRVIGDREGNGIQDVQVCFSKTDLQRLFSLVSGEVAIPVTIEGSLVDGQRFRAPITLDVIGGTTVLSASVTPNPFNPEAILNVNTTRSGALRVGLYDARGRLIRVLWDSPTDAGAHAIGIDGRDANGARLASGVYFYQVQTREGRIQGRLTILK